ncbi:MAG: hypothetical protein ACD_65C00081G0001 [uncultured bacterium]|nr:MAG: hypothetical protein ACD_65C00081G0001 [uncultured bacterium]
MHSILLTLQVVVSIFLVFAILLQQRGSGLGATFGGGGEFYATKRGAEKILANATVILVVMFLGLSLGLLFV